MDAIRVIVGEKMSILIGAIGARGGDREATIAAGGDNVIINSARAIIFASPGIDFDVAARKGALALHDEIITLRATLAAKA